MLLLSVLLLLLIIPATQPKCEWWKWGLTARWYKVTDEPSWRWGIQKEKTENKGEVSREVLGSSWVPVPVPIFSWLWEGSEPRALLVFNCKTAATWGLPWSYGAEGPCPHQLPPLQGPPALTLHLPLRSWVSGRSTCGTSQNCPCRAYLIQMIFYPLQSLRVALYPSKRGGGSEVKTEMPTSQRYVNLHMFLPDILYFYK